MAVLALFIPPLMLGVLLMLGRYEDLLLPPVRADDEPRGETPLGGLGR
ncbi:hypothetical protein GCM10010297_29220 [Streptomyces malachitofuscus]|nr:hypothetical protein GCM10010297_29220 [Streptomyces malachitofuscus]